MPGNDTMVFIRKIYYSLAVALNVCWFLLGDKLSLGAQMAVPVLTVALCCAGLLLGSRDLTGPARHRRTKWALWALLIYYLAILSVLLFFGGLFHVVRAAGGAVNLEPFHTIHNFFRHYLRTGSWFSLSNLLGNVVILIPMGVLLPVMFRPMRRFWLFLPLMALLAVGVEYVQWISETGVADVDDSILNFTGAALGYFVTRLCQIIGDYQRKRRKH